MRELDLFDLADIDARTPAGSPRRPRFETSARGAHARARFRAQARETADALRLAGHPDADTYHQATRRLWRANFTAPWAAHPTPHHAMTELTVDLRCTCTWPRPEPQCQCVGDFLHRGACLGCDWEGPPRDRENLAVEDAADHAHPGWRDLPVLSSRPHEQRGKTWDRWVARAAELYPPGWAQRPDAPVRTARNHPIATRHVPGLSPWGGYDMAALIPEGGGQ